MICGKQLNHLLVYAIIPTVNAINGEKGDVKHYDIIIIIIIIIIINVIAT
jgi:hypothetical protein